MTKVTKIASLTLGLIMTVGAMAPLSTASAADYTVGDLLDPCREGLNASREGEVAAMMECQQYMAGYRDASVAQGAKGLCFPAGSQGPVEMQRAYVKWAVNSTKAHGWPASDGMMAAFKCE